MGKTIRFFYYNPSEPLPAERSEDKNTLSRNNRHSPGTGILRGEHLSRHAQTRAGMVFFVCLFAAVSQLDWVSIYL